LIPRGWYGDKPDEVIVSDTDENIKKRNFCFLIKTVPKVPTDIKAYQYWQ